MADVDNFMIATPKANPAILRVFQASKPRCSTRPCTLEQS